MSAVALADAGPPHAPIVAALHAATIGQDGGDAWSADWVARLLGLPGAFAILAAAPDPVGFILCLPAGDAVDVAAIGVVAAHRRLGIGARLIAAGARRARAGGAVKLMLEVAADNDAAVTLYRMAGFREISRRRGYYRGTRDALVLVKSL